MKVAIRADASSSMGSGHVMRCLALADGLARRGAHVKFLTRRLPLHLAELIAAHGHGHSTLELTTARDAEAPQAGWSPEQQLQDARSSQAVLAGEAPDWLVVDHYGLDAHWERQMRGCAVRLLAIDDLARAHSCDTLLDANMHAAGQSRYAQVAAGARVLAGPSYALLRPEFAEARKNVAPRHGQVRRLLISLGGSDAGNATGHVLKAVGMAAGPLPEIDVVVGATHPALAEIQQACSTSAGRRCHVQTDKMADLLAAADAAVGAGGSTTWERCCLGVPTIALALAKNQSVVLQEAADAGVVLVPDDGLPAPERLAAHLEAFLHNSALRALLSRAGWAAVDGRGVDRVVAALMASGVVVRPARLEDSDRMLAWRNDKAVRSVSRQRLPIASADHHRWLTRVLAASDQVLLVGEDFQGAVGVVRFDLSGNEAEVSIYLASDRHGQGLGVALLASAEAWVGEHHPSVTCLRAEVLAGNSVSERLFLQAGYQPASRRFLKQLHT